MTRMASSALKIAARTIRKIHVPAYWPWESGVQFIEKRGVAEEKKNVMAMESMPIMEEEDIGIEELVAPPMAMPDIVPDAGIDVDIDIVLDAGIDVDTDIGPMVTDLSLVD